VFGLFEADLSAGELYRNGRRVALQEKPFRILALLLQRPGEVITREEVRRGLWPEGTFVDFDEGLDTALRKLRYALGDSAQSPTFIETIPRRGYRFIAPVSQGDLSSTVPSDIDTTPSTPPSPPLPVHIAKLGYFTVLVVVAVLLAVGYVFLWRSRARQPALSGLQVTALTHSGQVQGVAISPDGQYVVYASGAADKQSLWLHEITAQRDLQLVPAGAGFHGLTFSPDSGSIYFVRSDKNDPYFKYLYVTPTRGGPIRKLITDVDSPVSFSPDGTRFVYEHCLQPRDDIELRIANADGSDDRVLTVIHHGSGMFFQPGPNWSPDGRTIAVPVVESGDLQRWVLDVISVADGSSKELFSGARELGRPVWLAGGTALLFPYRESASHRFQLWTVSFPEGSAQPVTHDVSNYGTDLDMAKNSPRFLVTTAAVTSSHIWMAPASDLSQSRQVTSDSVPFRQIAEAFDGKLLVQGDDQAMWMMHTDGSQRFRFTDLQPADSPTRCGRFVILRIFQKDSLALTRFEKDGSHPTVLVRGNLYSPACSADSEFLFYLTGDQPQKIWKVPVMGGNPQYVVDGFGDQFTMILAPSPDGRFLAYGYTNYGRVPSKGWSIAVIPVGGGAPVKQFVVQGTNDSLRWSPSGKALQYLVTQNGVTNLWDQPLAGGKPKQLTQFSSGQIFDFNWSSDHMWLLMTRGSTNTDAVWLSNLQ